MSSLRVVGLADATFQRMKREILVWQGLVHPNVLRLYGFKSGERPCLVAPWCAYGNLDDYVRSHPELTVIDKLKFVRPNSVRIRARFSLAHTRSCKRPEASNTYTLESLLYIMAT